MLYQGTVGYKRVNFNIQQLKQQQHIKLGVKGSLNGMHFDRWMWYHRCTT